jgi:hypothetical protein
MVLNRSNGDSRIATVIILILKKDKVKVFFVGHPINDY